MVCVSEHIRSLRLRVGCSRFLTKALDASMDSTVAGLVLMTLAGSGFVSMLYEVAWTRALTAMIGSSTYAFSIMLVTFLDRHCRGKFHRHPDCELVAGLRLLGLTQLGVALGGLIFLIGIQDGATGRRGRASGPVLFISGNVTDSVCGLRLSDDRRDNLHGRDAFRSPARSIRAGSSCWAAASAAFIR